MSSGSFRAVYLAKIHVRPGESRRREGYLMPRYLISFDAHAMDHIPDEDMPAVA